MEVSDVEWIWGMQLPTDGAGREAKVVMAVATERILGCAGNGRQGSGGNTGGDCDRYVRGDRGQGRKG